MNSSNENNTITDADLPSLRSFSAFTLAISFFHPLESLYCKREDHDAQNADNYVSTRQQNEQEQSRWSLEAIDAILTTLPEELLHLVFSYITPFHLLLLQRYSEAKTEQKTNGTSNSRYVEMPSYLKEAFQMAWSDKISKDHNGESKIT